jgi:hypothetical protein
MIKTEIIFPERLPDLDMQDTLVDIAEKIFVPTMKENMDGERDLTEQAYPPLADSTLAQKRMKGLSPLVLHAENRLRNAFTITQQGKNTVVISLTPDRKEIGNILQNKGVKSKTFGLRFFNFFGVNSRMEDKAVKLMKKAIDKAIKDA